MSTPPPDRTRRRFLRDAGLLGAATSALPLAGAAALPGEVLAADAAGEGLVCPHPNPIVHENRCTNPDLFSNAFQVSGTNSVVGGFARRNSVNVGEAVELVVSGPNLYLPPSGQPPTETVEIDVYRLGYYDGLGGRLVWSTSGPLSTFQKVDAQGRPSNDGAVPADRPSDAATGLSGRAAWRTVATVPGSALTTSGVYLAKLKGAWVDYPPGVAPVPRTGESHVVFVVRDDARPRDLLVLLPTNTWQAYNYWSGRSTYTYNSRYGSSGSLVAATGTERAARVSCDRPYNNWVGDYNWVLRTEFPAIWWLERHGYDVAYTEDVALSFAPEQLLPGRSKGVAILGHGEYWSQGLRDGMDAARDAGTSIYNLGANTAYWRVRHETASGAPATSEANARVMVCYKTVEGGGSWTDGPGDGGESGTGNPGSSNERSVASKADPVSPTTTWRDPGKGPGIATPGTSAATPATYAGPGRPEAELLGVQYIGDDDARNRGLFVPADNGEGEFAGHRAWRNTSMTPSGAEIGSHLVGWEWDGIPATAEPFGDRPPATKPGSGGVRRLSQTDPMASPPAGAQTAYLLDAGRHYSSRGAEAAPPPGWGALAHAVSYTAPSGALVFSAGTIQWSWGLGPHYLHRNTDSYAAPPVDTSDGRISQATANLLADGAIVPITPEGLLFDVAEPDPGPIVEGGGDGEVTVPPPAGGGGGGGTPQPGGGTGGPSPTPPLPKLAVKLTSSRISATGRLTARVTATQQLPRTLTGTVELTLSRKRIARTTFTMRTTRSGMIALRLSASARATLLRKGTIKPIARITTHAADGKTKARTDLVRLTVTRAKRSKG